MEQEAHKGNPRIPCGWITRYVGKFFMYMFVEWKKKRDVGVWSFDLWGLRFTIILITGPIDFYD